MARNRGLTCAGTLASHGPEPWHHMVRNGGLPWTGISNMMKSSGKRPMECGIDDDGDMRLAVALGDDEDRCRLPKAWHLDAAGAGHVPALRF